jgi:tight adherence protein B
MQLTMVLVFFAVFGVMMISIAVAAQFLERQRKQRVSGVLKNIEDAPARPEPAKLVRRTEDLASPLQQFLSRLNFAARVESWLAQSGLGWDFAGLVIATAIAAGIGCALGLMFRQGYPAGVTSIALACLLGALPSVYVRRKRRKRLAEFEQEFPEALDFLARAIKAGHAFTTSLEMLSQESSEPLRSEFRRVYREQNLGESVAVVLRHLAARVPLLDVRFFVSAVLMQRETGGNLGEILTNLAHVIRERFRLKGQVRAITAHGRITATVLTFLPVLTILALMATSPEFLKVLLTEKEGKYLITGAVFGQVLGYIVMRRIVNIRV